VPDSKSNGQTDHEKAVDKLLFRRKGLSGNEFAGAGLQFGTTIVVFALGGIWLDRRLGTSPWLMILAVFGGAALGFWSMYRVVIRAERKGQ
jgi:hypothetical protein